MSIPRLAFQAENGGRGYRHPVTGQTVPSITTIIGAKSKPALVPWAVKATAEKAVSMRGQLLSAGRVPDCGAKRPAKECGRCLTCLTKQIKRASSEERDYAADRGTRVHEYAEAWANDHPLPPIDPDMRGMVASLMSFLDDYSPEFTWIEATVWSETHGYAGTLDWTALIGGVPSFGDWKTGKAVYPEVGMQIAAAVNADYIIGPDGTQYPIPACEQAFAVSLRPQGYTAHRVERLDESFEAFLGLLRVHQWTADTAGLVLQ